MTTDNKTLADVQPGGRVRLGDQAERARFEAWAISRGWSIQRWADGLQRYCSCDTERMWEAFQAAAQPSPATCKEGLQVQPSPGGQGDALLEEVARFLDYSVGHDPWPNIRRAYGDAWWEPVRKMRDDLRALAARQPVGEPVAYLDLGTGGYMDVGTDLSDEELAALPKGRHMLGIIGTYGVDGYKPAQAVDLDK